MVGTDAPIRPGIAAYLGQRARNAYFDFVMRKFVASGMTRPELAKRIGVSSRKLQVMLAHPGEWTFDTVSLLLAGIGSEELVPQSRDIPVVHVQAAHDPALTA